MTEKKVSSITVYNIKGEELEKLELDPEVFDGKVNTSVMHQVVTAYLASQRAGTASAKTRGEVSGGGRKPWKQKHTGRARAGSNRSPLWRKGGVVFGPKPRDYSINPPKRMKALALKSALNAKFKAGEMKVVDAFNLAMPKTREVVALFKSLQLGGNALLVTNGEDKIISKAAGNLPGVEVSAQLNINTYHILLHTHLVIAKPALEKLSERLK